MIYSSMVTITLIIMIIMITLIVMIIRLLFANHDPSHPRHFISRAAARCR